MIYFAKRKEGDLSESQFIKAKPGHAAAPANAFALRVKKSNGDKPDLMFRRALGQLMTELGKRGLTGKNNEEGWKIHYGKYKTFMEMTVKDFCCVFASTQLTVSNWINRMTDLSTELWSKMHEYDVVFKTNDPRSVMLFLFDIFDHKGMSYYDWDERGFETFEQRVIKKLLEDIEPNVASSQPQ